MDLKVVWNTSMWRENKGETNLTDRVSSSHVGWSLRLGYHLQPAPIAFDEDMLLHTTPQTILGSSHMV